MKRKSNFVLWFSEVSKEDIPQVGGKGANLGEMVQAKFPVPDGFIVTAQAYFKYLKETNIEQKIKHLLSTTNYNKQDSIVQVSGLIKKEIMRGTMSDELVEHIFSYYKQLSGTFGDALVAVRSSATAEDLPGASFAGQQETFLNIKGDANLIQYIKKAWASLFEPRAIFYRHEKKYDTHRVGIAIVVQKMIASEMSGVMFTIDPVTNDKSKIVIEAIYGLGEMIVQGQATPDHYEVSKKEREILFKKPSEQKIQLKKVGTVNKEVSVSMSIRKKQKITDGQILKLAELGHRLEKHYYFPQDIEWAIEKNNVYIVQTRPVTTITDTKPQDSQASTDALKDLTVILKGDPASPGIASGPVKVIRSSKEIGLVVAGDILVAPQTNPDYVPAMKKAVAIVTDSGGRTSHAAIVSRELGIPAIVGAQTATKLLKTGNTITVNGSTGTVYKGGHLQGIATKISTSSTLQKEHIKTATKVYVNLAQPDIADRVAGQNVDGVGLLRAEFMMADIGVHPRKLLKDGKRKVFVESLSHGLEKIARAFNPRPVVYRTSDFKTNEYRNLIGGKEFEPVEPNPMLGYRGAFRYIYDPKVFEMELDAIKHVRNKLGLKNLWVMIPFVRTVQELIKVKRIISEAGLYRSDSFKLWMMVEIPSNVILLDKFIDVGIDGISIGSNDLTMLIMGTDRDNSEVASAYDEQNEAVIWALEHIIKTAKKRKITASICGQAPSQYPHLTEKLIELGITSVSIAPDVIDSTRQTISHIEKKLIS